ncbi:MAG: DUF4350 domain-containing protein [Gemmatimonas sp.]
MIAPVDQDMETVAAAIGGDTRTRWYARPGVVLPVLGAIVLVTALLARDPVSGRNGDPRLSAYSAAPLGARLLYELADRLGWDVRRVRTASVPVHADETLAVLDPTIALRASEVHGILNGVRAGGALLLAMGSGTRAFSDSLHIAVDQTGGVVDTRVGETSACEQTRRERFTRAGLWFGDASLFGLKGSALNGQGVRTFVYARGAGTLRAGGSAAAPRPAMIGMPFGAGRVVVASDPDVFRNDALRDCSYGLDVPVVRALEYLRDGGAVRRVSIVFDEYHLGRGARAGTMGAVQTFLRDTRWGHALLQVCAAGLLLLLAAAHRVLPPRDDPRIERRSPLEHVDALARAYSNTDASRTATLRLVRGLRRRVDRGTLRARAGDRDEAFLDRVAESIPARGADVALVRRALTHAVSHAEFREVGSAVQRIEAAHARA